MSIKEENIVTAVCCRLGETDIVSAIAICDWCGEACGMSEETRKLFRSHAGVHRIICIPCHTAQLGRPLTIQDLHFSPEQLREIAEYLLHNMKGEQHGTGTE